MRKLYAVILAIGFATLAFGHTLPVPEYSPYLRNSFGQGWDINFENHGVQQECIQWIKHSADTLDWANPGKQY